MSQESSKFHKSPFWRLIMGCDIHDFVEIKVNDKWEMVGEVFENYDKRLSKHPYDGRNYTLFGLLAGVRNTNVIPISGPKGVPIDDSQDFLDELEQWGNDGHSISYLTLKEILDYPLWNIEIPIAGFVNANQYNDICSSGRAKSTFFKNVGSDETIISNEEMDRYIVNPKDFLSNNPTMNPYTKVEWYETVRDWAGDYFWDKVILRMKDLAPNGDYDRIRLVFFFDN